MKQCYDLEKDAGTAAARPSGNDSALLASMSHDLRTPMNGVLGMAELLLAADDLGDRHRRRVEVIKRSGETVLAMLDHIIELSKIDADASKLSSSPLDFRELVLEAYRRFQLTDFGKSSRTDLVDDLDDHHRVLGDAAHLERLISTLLKSAADFAKEPCLRIIVTAKPATPQRTRIRFAVQSAVFDAKSLKTHLTALEAGEPPAQAEFESMRNLSICRKLAESMGGDILLDLHADGTAVLRADFDLASSFSNDAHWPVHEAHETTCSADGVRSQTNTIRDVLVAEDDPDMALLIEDLLDEAGYRATVASNGASVLEFMDERSFDVVLMDGRLPDMTGFEAASFIRNLPDERAGIPIIALTGDALDGDRERYLSAGMDDYIAKPVSYTTLVETIERCQRGSGLQEVR